MVSLRKKILSREDYCKLGQYLADKMNLPIGRKFEVKDTAEIQIGKGIGITIDGKEYVPGVYVVKDGDFY